MIQRFEEAAKLIQLLYGERGLCNEYEEANRIAAVLKECNNVDIKYASWGSVFSILGLYDSNISIAIINFLFNNDLRKISKSDERRYMKHRHPGAVFSKSSQEWILKDGQAMTRTDVKIAALSEIALYDKGLAVKPEWAIKHYNR